MINLNYNEKLHRFASGIWIYLPQKLLKDIAAEITQIKGQRIQNIAPTYNIKTN